MPELTYAELVAENARLRALLPPLPAPDQIWRQGTKNAANLYAHADGLAPRGEAVGQMRSIELAAHVARAVNALDWERGVTEGRMVLDLPMDDRDSGATTVRGYLVALAKGVWEEGEGFSGKRPFGNSGWESDVYIPLVKAGLIEGKLDEDGWLDEVDEAAGRELIDAAIAELAVAR